MHNAPSVSYPVGRCVSASRFLMALTLITGCVLLGWWYEQGLSMWLALAVGWSALAALLAWRAWKAQGGVLTWDGQVWCWHGAPRHADAIGHVQVVLDLQHTLLLRWQPTDKPISLQTVNLWLSAESAPDFWQDLRRAVYAPQPLG